LSTKKRSLFKGDSMWGYIMVGPQVIGLLVFVVFPVLMAFYLCFTSWDMINAPKFVGLDNFRSVFIADRDVFWKTILNTFVLLTGIIPLTVACSLGLAMLCNKQIKGLSFYKAAYFLPMVTSAVSIAIVWFWLYAPDFGLINAVLTNLGIKNPPGWLTDTAWAKVAIIIMSVWMKLGYYFIIFLAGLKGIPRNYYEAAEIDGASSLQIFKRITLPMLSPVTFFCVVMLFIDFFNLFDVPFVLTRGGPAYSTYTLVLYVYNQAFEFFKMGEAAVSSMLLFVIVAVVTAIQFAVSKRMVNYDVQ
jgi:multiple sugar transport system permease protein